MTVKVRKLQSLATRFEIFAFLLCITCIYMSGPSLLVEFTDSIIIDIKLMYNKSTYVIIPTVQGNNIEIVICTSCIAVSIQILEIRCFH